jgi:isopenicillin N synthase-like dioxygenase
VNCTSSPKSGSQGNISSQPSQYHEYTGENIWPREDLLPGFRPAFEELCALILDVATLVARVCDEYALATIQGYEPRYLQNMVKTSTTTKARLLHYYPQELPTRSDPPDDIPRSAQKTQQVEVSNEIDGDQDSWCASHVDHGCLTALTSALYIDESLHPPQIPYSSDTPSASLLPPLPSISVPPPSAGLYIQSRTSTITKVSIPPDCLAFQTGEALQLITGGRFRAVPHFVRAGEARPGEKIARNTLAIFMQPELGKVVDKNTGLTFGEFCKKVGERFR